MPASCIYITSPEGDTGKSTIALGVLHRLAATVAKVGVFRPITRLGEDRDYILDLLLPQTTAGLPYEQCVGVNYQQLHDDQDAAIAEIVDRYHTVADDARYRALSEHHEFQEAHALLRRYAALAQPAGTLPLPPPPGH